MEAILIFLVFILSEMSNHWISEQMSYMKRITLSAVWRRDCKRSKIEAGRAIRRLL